MNIIVILIIIAIAIYIISIVLGYKFTRLYYTELRKSPILSDSHPSSWDAISLFVPVINLCYIIAMIALYLSEIDYSNSSKFFRIK